VAKLRRAGPPDRRDPRNASPSARPQSFACDIRAALTASGAGVRALKAAKNMTIYMDSLCVIDALAISSHGLRLKPRSRELYGLRLHWHRLRRASGGRFRFTKNL
jgi:hypothetical protein